MLLGCTGRWDEGAGGEDKDGERGEEVEVGRGC